MKCATCGSSEIQLKAWIWLNGEDGSGDPSIAAGAFDYEGAWCMSCDAETALIEGDAVEG